MNKIRKVVMIASVLMAITGAFAFKADKHTYQVKDRFPSSVTPVLTSPGLYSVTYNNSSNNPVAVSGEYTCDQTSIVCTFTQTGTSTTTNNGNGTTTITNVQIEAGQFTPIP